MALAPNQGVESDTVSERQPPSCDPDSENCNKNNQTASDTISEQLISMHFRASGIEPSDPEEEDSVMVSKICGLLGDEIKASLEKRRKLKLDQVAVEQKQAIEDLTELEISKQPYLTVHFSDVQKGIADGNSFYRFMIQRFTLHVVVPGRTSRADREQIFNDLFIPTAVLELLKTTEEAITEMYEWSTKFYEKFLEGDENALRLLLEEPELDAYCVYLTRQAGARFVAKNIGTAGLFPYQPTQTLRDLISGSFGNITTDQFLSWHIIRMNKKADRIAQLAVCHAFCVRLEVHCVGNDTTGGVTRWDYNYDGFGKPTEEDMAHDDAESYKCILKKLPPLYIALYHDTRSIVVRAGGDVPFHQLFHRGGADTAAKLWCEKGQQNHTENHILDSESVESKESYDLSGMSKPDGSNKILDDKIRDQAYPSVDAVIKWQNEESKGVAISENVSFSLHGDGIVSGSSYQNASGEDVATEDNQAEQEQKQNPSSWLQENQDSSEHNDGGSVGFPSNMTTEAEQHIARETSNTRVAPPAQSNVREQDSENLQGGLATMLPTPLASGTMSYEDVSTSSNFRHLQASSAFSYRFSRLWRASHAETLSVAANTGRQEDFRSLSIRRSRYSRSTADNIRSPQRASVQQTTTPSAPIQAETASNTLGPLRRRQIFCSSIQIAITDILLAILVTIVLVQANWYCRDYFGPRRLIISDREEAMVGYPTDERDTGYNGISDEMIGDSDSDEDIFERSQKRNTHVEGSDNGFGGPDENDQTEAAENVADSTTRNSSEQERSEAGEGMSEKHEAGETLGRLDTDEAAATDSLTIFEESNGCWYHTNLAGCCIFVVGNAGFKTISSLNSNYTNFEQQLHNRKHVLVELSLWNYDTTLTTLPMICSWPNEDIQFEHTQIVDVFKVQLGERLKSQRITANVNLSRWLFGKFPVEDGICFANADWQYFVDVLAQSGSGEANDAVLDGVFSREYVVLFQGQTPQAAWSMFRGSEKLKSQKKILAELKVVFDRVIEHVRSLDSQVKFDVLMDSLILEPKSGVSQNAGVECKCRLRLDSVVEKSYCEDIIEEKEGAVAIVPQEIAEKEAEAERIRKDEAEKRAKELPEEKRKKEAQKKEKKARERAAKLAKAELEAQAKKAAEEKRLEEAAQQRLKQKEERDRKRAAAEKQRERQRLQKLAPDKKPKPGDRLIRKVVPRATRPPLPKADANLNFGMVSEEEDEDPEPPSPVSEALPASVSVDPGTPGETLLEAQDGENRNSHSDSGALSDVVEDDLNKGQRIPAGFVGDWIRDELFHRGGSPSPLHKSFTEGGTITSDGKLIFCDGETLDLRVLPLEEGFEVKSMLPTGLLLLSRATT